MSSSWSASKNASYRGVRLCIFKKVVQTGPPYCLTKLRIQILAKLMPFERWWNFTSMEAKISLPLPFCFAKSKHEFHSWAEFQHHHHKNGPPIAFLPIIYENNGHFLIPGTFSDTYVYKNNPTIRQYTYFTTKPTENSAAAANLQSKQAILFYFLNPTHHTQESTNQQAHKQSSLSVRNKLVDEPK